MNVEIRKASLDQLDLLLKWRMEVLEEVFKVPQELKSVLKQANREYYIKALKDNSHIAIFALVDNKIVGCGGVCFFQEMPSPDNLSGQCAYLMNIYTRKLFRNQGIGREIVKYLIKEAKKRKITKIYLETSEVARSLYKELGFSDLKDYLILNKN